MPAVDPRLRALTIRYANKYGVDPVAALSVAAHEGGLRLVGAGVGDNNTSFGPWQLHIGGAMPTQYRDPVRARRFAESPQGVEYAIRSMSKVAKGLTGLEAIRAIVNEFERPREDLRAGEIKKSWQTYRQLSGSRNRDLSIPPPSPTAPMSGGPDASRGALLNYLMSGLDNFQRTGQVRNDLLGLAVSFRMANGQTEPSSPTDTVTSGALAVVGDRAIQPVIGYAIDQKGIPYSWGGGTPRGPSKGIGRGANTVGWDCSALVQAAWAQVGVQLPRTTYDQIKVGKAVRSIREARPGDLLFPSRGHVQMYLGNGKVVEAPYTGGRVQIVPVRSSYIAIRRPR